MVVVTLSATGAPFDGMAVTYEIPIDEQYRSAYGLARRQQGNATVSDQYDVWRAEKANPTPPERRDDRPKDHALIGGYYRIESAKTKPDYPVLIWTADGETEAIFQIGRKRMRTDTHADEWQDFVNGAWLHCVAVDKAAWAAALETGFWPSDNKPARQMSTDEKLGISTEQSGGNDAPIEETLADQIEALADKLEKAKEPTTQAEADALTGDLDRMRALLKKATDVREDEYRPHKDAADAVSTKWATIMKPGQEAGKTAEAKRKAYLAKEQRRLDDIAAEERRKREEEARKAAQAERERLQAEADARAEEERERRRVEAEAKAKAAEEARIAAEADAAKKAEADRLAAEAKAAEEAAANVQAEVVAEPEVVVEKVEAKRASAGTTFGRQSGLKKVKVGKIVNLSQMIAAMLFDESRGQDADLMEYLQGRADKAAKGGFPLPGTVIEEAYR